MLFVIWSTRRDKNKIYIVYVITQPVSNNEYFLIKPSKIYISYIQKKNIQRQIQGREGFPLFLDRTETRRAEKFFLETASPLPALSKGLDGRASPLLSGSWSGTDIDFFFEIRVHFPHYL